MPPHSRKRTASNANELVALPTLGVLADGEFIPLDPLTLKSFMDVPLRSWDDDFPELERERYRNLKCMMPSGRLVPGLVPIVKEFDGTWDGERRIAVWEDGRRAFRVENVVERNGLLEAFDIDPIPTPCFAPTPRVIRSPISEALHYGGWTEKTYLHVIPAGDDSGTVSILSRTVQQLDGLTCAVYMGRSNCTQGLPAGVPRTAFEEVRIATWNCRGIPRATFRPNLYTLRSTTESAVVVLTETRACGTNAREILNQAHGLNYCYTDTSGFIGGMAVLWDTSKVFLYGFRTDANHVAFRVKVLIS